MPGTVAGGLVPSTGVCVGWLVDQICRLLRSQGVVGEPVTWAPDSAKGIPRKHAQALCPLLVALT